MRQLLDGSFPPQKIKDFKNKHIDDSLFVRIQCHYNDY